MSLKEKIKALWNEMNWKLTSFLIGAILFDEIVVDWMTLGRTRIIDDKADYFQIIFGICAMFSIGTYLSHILAKEDKIKKKLRETNILYESLFQNSPYGNVIIDPSTKKIIKSNQMAAEQLGYAIDEFENRLSIYDIEAIEAPLEVNQRVQDVQTKGYEEFTTKQKTKTGEIKDIHVIAQILNVEDKDVYMCTWQDITEKLTLEKKLRRSHKMEVLGTIAGGVAHDLNNILSAQIGYPDLLLYKLPEDSPLRDDVEKIKQSAIKAAVITQDLLTLARGGIAKKTPLNINDILSNYFKSPEFEKLKSEFPNVSFNIDLKDLEINIEGSAIHLAKAFMNLVNNAAEAIKDKGNVEISSQFVQLQHRKNGYETIPKGNYALIQIKDNGIGFDPDKVKDIFEAFFSKKELGKSGTGLGMTIVDSTIKDHDGFIDIYTRKEQGFTFSIYLPTTSKKIIRDNNKKSLGDYIGNQQSIMIIDDDIGQIELASDILKKLNYGTTAIQDGDQAIKYLKRNQADVILLDMIMPGLNGIETFEKIREINPQQKFIICSGYSTPDQIDKVRRLGLPYIKKPYSLKTLGDVLKRTLEQLPHISDKMITLD